VFSPEIQKFKYDNEKICPAVVIDGKDKHFVSSMQCSFSFSDVIVGGTWRLFL
jgi:hypothetical protein